MNWYGYGSKTSSNILRYYPNIWTEGLRKTKKNFSYNTRHQDREFKRGLDTETQCSPLYRNNRQRRREEFFRSAQYPKHGAWTTKRAPNLQNTKYSWHFVLPTTLFLIPEHIM